MKLPEKSRRVRWIKSSGRIVLLNPDKGRYYNLNSVASIVWDMCDGTNDVLNISEEICATFYGRGIKSVLNDVKELLGEMKRNGLIIYRR